jgi:3-phenylpropionate/trans-cinnamate dioxygenase ferredoxin subunit
MPNQFVRAAKTCEIPNGGMAGVTVQGEEVLIARVGGQYYAIHNKCSHQGGALDEGELLSDRCAVMCPLHDACFDLRTGEPIAGPAKKAVKAYAVLVEGDDILLGPVGS